MALAELIMSSMLTEPRLFVCYIIGGLTGSALRFIDITCAVFREAAYEMELPSVCFCGGDTSLRVFK